MAKDYKNRKNETQDTILHIYQDILREIEINKDFAAKGDVKARIEDAERELSNVIKATRDFPKKDRIAFTQQPRNVLRMLKGEDYHFTISDGFDVYTIKKSTIEEKKDKVASYLLKRFRDNVNKAIKDAKKDEVHTERYIEKQLDALERLKMNINKNISIINMQNEYIYDDYWNNKINEEAYPIFQNVTGLSISINI